MLLRVGLLDREEKKGGEKEEEEIICSLLPH